MAQGTNSKANDDYRKTIMEDLMKFFKDRGEEVIQIGNNKFCFPFVNSLEMDEFCEVTVSIPRGSIKDKTPYDGYELGEDFLQKKIKDEKKAKEQAEKKEKDIKRDTAKREIAKKKMVIEE